MPLALVAVLLAAALATWLLIRTAVAANDINEKAEQIARNGRGINAATDSIMQLRRTNRIAESILRSAAPLDAKLRSTTTLAGRIDRTAGTIGQTAAAIDSTAGRIDSTAQAIGGTAGAIEGTAGRIDSTAGGIEVAVGGILPVARAIDFDTRLINLNLDRTIGLARLINGDSGNILDQGLAIHQTSACIDRRLGGRSGFDGHCEENR